MSQPSFVTDLAGFAASYVIVDEVAEIGRAGNYVILDDPHPWESPELRFAYSGADFNEDFGPTALARIARERAHARGQRKAHNYLRYRRMCRRRMQG